MFGGCGLGAAVSAMEAVCDRPVVWATAQYLSFAMVGEIMDLDVTVAVAGKRTSQARAVGRVGDREILTVNAALGSKDIKIDEQWRTMPEVPNPQDCPLRSDMVADSESIMGRLNIRLALGSPWDEIDGNPAPRGRSALWVQTPDIEMSAAGLAILGDYLPFGIAQATGRWVPSNSLRCHPAGQAFRDAAHQLKLLRAGEPEQSVAFFTIDNEFDCAEQLRRVLDLINDNRCRPGL